MNADVNVWLNDYLLHQIEICNFYKDLLEKRGDKLARKKNRDRIQILGRVIKKRTDQKIKMKNTVSQKYLNKCAFFRKTILFAAKHNEKMLEKIRKNVDF